MSEMYRSTTETGDTTGTTYKGSYPESMSSKYEHMDDDRETGGSEAGKALLVGLLGGLLSAAGYVIYQRLPEDQKDRLQRQARDIVTQRFNEFKENFKNST